MQLTIFLVNVGNDPFSYRFPISVPEVGNIETVVANAAEDSEVKVQDATKEAFENIPVSGIVKNSENVIRLADGVLAISENVAENRDNELMEAE